jgi:acyl CoA:acetate/3-ketoacid CoA transferase beta subunit
MDIAADAKTLIVCLEHTTKDGVPAGNEFRVIL